VVVVGGGPAGLIAAEVLATAGASVTLIERMPSPGRKFQLAGRSGLNLTHDQPIADLVANYGRDGPRLAGAIEAFGPEALRTWSAGLGVETFVGSSGRIFPVGGRSTTLLRAWISRLDEIGVERRTGHEWRGWHDDGSLAVVDLATGGDAAVGTPVATLLALGGASWPRTGSDGAWVRSIEAVGIRAAPLRPANCGLVLTWSRSFLQRFEGTPVKNVRLAYGTRTVAGDLVVTRDGLEGGPVYALSSAVGAQLDAGADQPVLLHADLRPDLAEAEIASRLARGRGGESVANRLRRTGLSPVAIALLRESAGSAPPADPGHLAALVKKAPLAVEGTQPIARAISSAGGLVLDELDDSFMVRRRPGVFVAGEMLDWDAPTGGYLLQAAFSTGVAAARGVLNHLGHDGT
jgi:hypothetical protein